MAAPNNVWNIKPLAVETKNFAEIMSEEYAKQQQCEEFKRYEKKALNHSKAEQQPNAASLGVGKSYAETATTSKAVAITNAAANNGSTEIWENYEHLLYNDATTEHAAKPPTEEELSDAAIAIMLQKDADIENDEAVQRREKQRNKQSKVTVSFDKFRRLDSDEYEAAQNVDAEEEEDEVQSLKRDWDRFETNEKKFDTIPKCGFKIDKEGEMITKHDPDLCGVRNACRVMSFPPEFPTGDGACFDMKLSNKVFNQLKTYSRRNNNNKKNKMQDRKEQAATAEMGLDTPTVMLLYKFINNHILEQVNGIISTGKEAVILHAESDPNYIGEELENSKQNTAASHSNYLPALTQLLPKECAIKVFKTTLNEFKQRDRYIKDDYRFKDRFSKQNNRVIINMWAEKEMHNMMRMQSVGINCPDVVMLKDHVLVMSFIGENHNAAPKLKDARLNMAELSGAYEEIVEAMHKLYNGAKLVHADLSEYNILWFKGKCWFIDVAQSVEPEHPSALEFLMRDCSNIVNFFTKRGLPNIFTKEQLFEHVTSLNAENHNAAMLERIHTRGATIEEATAPNQEECPDELKPLAFPFDLAWEKSLIEREQKHTKQTTTDASATNIDADPTNTANH